jgi:hypothetical protein
MAYFLKADTENQIVGGSERTKRTFTEKRKLFRKPTYPIKSNGYFSCIVAQLTSLLYVDSLQDQERLRDQRICIRY